MKDSYRGLILIITLFPIAFIFPILLTLIEYYPSKTILNVFYFGVIIFCYGALFTWFYFLIKFIRRDFK